MKSIFLYLLLFSTGLHSQSDIIRKNNYNVDSKGLAVQGYDVISYYTSSIPKLGKKENKYLYKGVTYHFETATTLNIFKLNPEKWEPAYGGWCAYAMGNTGEKVEIDPKTFKILENKLYLFYNAYLTNTLPKWNKEEANLKLKAEKNWAIIISK